MTKRITTKIEVGNDLVGIVPHTVDDNDRVRAMKELARFSCPKLEVTAVRDNWASEIFYKPFDGDLQWSIDDTGNGEMTLHGRKPRTEVRVVSFYVTGNLQSGFEIEIERDVDLHEAPLTRSPYFPRPLALEELEALAENYFRRLYAIHLAVNTDSDVFVFFNCLRDRPKWAQIDHTRDVQPVQWVPGRERFDISRGSRHGLLIGDRVHWNSGATTPAITGWLMPSSAEMARDAILSYELQR